MQAAVIATEMPSEVCILAFTRVILAVHAHLQRHWPSGLLSNTLIDVIITIRLYFAILQICEPISEIFPETNCFRNVQNPASSTLCRVHSHAGASDHQAASAALRCWSNSGALGYQAWHRQQQHPARPMHGKQHTFKDDLSV